MNKTDSSTSVSQPTLRPSIVTLSGGLDSVANLAFFVSKVRETGRTEILNKSLCVTFDYGQKAGVRERAAAHFFSEFFQIPWKEIDLTWLGKMGGSGLTDPALIIPEISSLDLDKLVTTQTTAKQVWVPNRNGVMIEVAAAYADRLEIGQVLVGFNAEEAATFPDNSEEYLVAVTKALKFSTRNSVEVRSYTTHLNKNQIVKELKAHHRKFPRKFPQELPQEFPFEKLWPCYRSEISWCLSCESCKRFLRAIEQDQNTNQDTGEGRDSCKTF